MPKSTTGCRIKSFIPVENMNVEKLRETQSSINKLARSLLNEFKKVVSALLATAKTNIFFSIMIFVDF